MEIHLITRFNLPVSVGVVHVKVLLVPSLEFTVNLVDLTNVSISGSVHLTAHDGALIFQDVGDFTGDIRNTSFCCIHSVC